MLSRHASAIQKGSSNNDLLSSSPEDKKPNHQLPHAYSLTSSPQPGESARVPSSRIVNNCTPTNSTRNVRPARKLNILVVDDVPSNRKVVAKLLEGMGHTTRMAEDGLKAFELVVKSLATPLTEDIEAAITVKPFDMIIMDFVMPNMVS